MIAIISDIHGNFEALQAVLERCQQLGVTRYLCLGDIIGYGPDPVAVTRVAVETFAVSLLGNHEEALVTGKHRFNPYAAKAIDWTRSQLNSGTRGISRLFRRTSNAETPPDYLGWYRNLRNFVIEQNFLLVHGSIYDPVHDYVDEPENPVEAQQMIDTLNRDFTGFDICFAGHNHTPFMATTVGTIFPHAGRSSFRVPKGHKVYVCVGSVGQPRDRNWQASFATLDGEMLAFHRIPYDIRLTQKKILDVGLHPFLAERLAAGV